MEMALYDEEYGYYRGDPFGKHGDFFTASQLQPVFGSYVRMLAQTLMPDFEAVIDIGAGREEMSAAFEGVPYYAVQFGQRIPETNGALLFANEFFDALPVQLFADGKLISVDCKGEIFFWSPALSGEMLE